MSKKPKPRPRPVVHTATPSYVEQIPARWTDEALAKQGYIDVEEDWLWARDGGESYRKTLRDHLHWWSINELNDKGRVGMYHIIEKNNILRERAEQREQAAAAAAVVAPPDPPPLAAVVAAVVTLAEENAALRAELARLKAPSTT